MKKEKMALPKLSLKKVMITPMEHREMNQVLGGLTGNCPPPSALRTIVRCMHPTTTVQHTFDC
ncbi:class I lanthipeptide [Taibaiella koreensis]|uniref:class I lanthipeptide n=1 Tax=Taibaiella koreensis TaxID=1268548 RepID=UPI000E59EBC2|nr:class I lanthipeptide [Taibaiella koreensis]